MNEGALFSRLYVDRVAELEHQLSAQKVRAEASESALAFERSQREQATARLIEMGRQAIQCKEENNHLRLAQATLESNMRFQLGDRVAKDLDQAYQNKIRELEDLLRKLFDPARSHARSRQDEQDLKDLVLATLEEFRIIVRRAL